MEESGIGVYFEPESFESFIIGLNQIAKKSIDHNKFDDFVKNYSRSNLAVKMLNELSSICVR